MFRRLLTLLLAGMMLAAITARAQTPPATPAAGAASVVKGGGEAIMVVKVTGTVQMTVNGTTTNLKVDDAVPRSAKINTLRDSSVILSFSNGATTHLGAETELIVEEYLQDPFTTTQKVAEMTEEPSLSKTKLRLNRGELVGKVAKLKHDQGSTFVIETPVGAAGIRGTTFRIVFTPNGTGQAFFQLSTVEGNVGFATPGSGIDPSTGTNAAGTTNVTGNGQAALPVPGGQQIEITVDVTTNAAGQQVITIVQPPTSTVNIPTGLIAQVTQTATEIAVATQTATFTPAPSGGGTTGGGTTGGTTSGTTSGSTTDNSSNTNNTTNNTTQNISGSNFTGTIQQNTGRQVTSGDGASGN